MAKQRSAESNSVVAGILGFLSDTGKTNLLSSVVDVLDEVADKTKHAERIDITSAIALTKGEISTLRRTVSHFLKRDLPAENTIDKNLIGGLAIRVGDFFLDATLASELRSVKELVLS